MKKVINDWRRYQLMNERVNRIDSNLRFIHNRLSEVSEDYSKVHITDVELGRIKRWGNLKGEPEFLGSGSKGIAYKFDNKVLKITEDSLEAAACNNIVGISHANVYEVYGVAERREEDRKEHLRNMPFVIVYEFLDYPNKLMAEVAQIMYHKVRATNLYYNWNPSNLEVFKILCVEFLEKIKKDESILGDPIGKYSSIEKKLHGIINIMGWDKEKEILFFELWSLTEGLYNTSLNSFPDAAKHIKDTLDNPKIFYFHQLANGLTFLYDNGIEYTDLKNTNVMEKNGQIAIIDIGKSAVKNRKKIQQM